MNKLIIPLVMLTVSIVVGCSTPETSSPASEPHRVTLQENYAGFCHLDGVVTNDIKGYEASGYAHVESAEGSAVGWKVSVAEAGVYQLIWRYTGEASVRGRVDSGNSTAVIEFAGTGNTGHWQNVTIALPLKTGVNNIRLSTLSAPLPLIDSLSLTGETVAAVNCDGTPVAAYQPNPRCVAGATFTDEVVDCGGARIGLACKGGESQPAVLTLENATVKNVRLKADGGSDGIWCTKGDCTLENVIWEDICEDAATQKSTPGSTLTIIGGWAWNNGGGKIFQHNAPDTTVVVTGGFTAKGRSAKLLRACGNCVGNGGNKKLILDNVRVDGVLSEEVVAPNKNYGDVATVRNLYIKDYDPEKQDVCAEWIGYDKSEKKPSERLGEAWNTEHCQVRREDVQAY